jgi:hypothetical protein
MAISKQQTMTRPASRQQKTSQLTYEELNNIIGRGLEILNDCDSPSEVDQNDETDSGTSSQSSRSHRAIQFSPANKVFEIMTLEEYSEKELRRCWYSPEEKEKICHSKDKIVARLEAGKKPRSDMIYRGLECWTIKGGQELDENIARSVNSVMDEQDRQWALNCDDWNAIAEVSAAVTADSGKIAREVAIEDEKEAKLAWEAVDDLSAASQHSTMSESVPATTRKHIFDVLKRHSSSHAKRRVGATEEQSLAEAEEKRRKTKKSKKTSSKKSRRSCSDPPAPVKRSASQDASELLLKMVSAGRQMASMKL